MFCADAKAKRVAKIKSKGIENAQVVRRSRGLIKEAEGLDSVEDGEKEKMKREVERGTL
ncbi:hypothetical protein JB92DRAFT_2840603 [Gautieria morchelliformis]|nr:hypothetical protein JB92DRAFT_2840603 [Gautieria morchelliformis]